MEKEEVLASNVPREFVFQWMERREPARKEIEQVMDQMQFMADREGLPRNYQDPHFRKSDDIPPLQCVDAIAWVSYKYAQRVFRKDRGPFKRFIAESLREFGIHKGKNGWLLAKTLTKDKLEKGIT